MFVRAPVRRRRPSSAAVLRRPARRLRFESLDPRCVLSATPLELEAAPPAEVTETCQAEVAPAVDTATAAATDEMFATLGPVYPAKAAATQTYLSESRDAQPLDTQPLDTQPLTGTLDGPEGEDPPPLGGSNTITALEITEFTVDYNSYGWIFRGKIQITGSYSMMLQVKLGGLLQGQYAVVNSRGEFSHYWAPPPGVTGDVSAQAIAGSVTSEIVWLSIV